jgi:D-alanyl-D-alanine-carboxypeptidase/D-alanyl-D-alanine-endopeptidase
MRLMPHRRAFLLAPLAASVGAINADAETFSEEAIQAILVQRIDVGHQSTGIVAVVSDKAGNRLFTYGRPDTPDNRPLDGETVFEIGSTTKVLTALLLTDMVTRSEIAFGDPAAEYLPTSVRMPENKGKPITLVDLATYTSALPPMPDNIISKDPFNPFADYTIDQFYAFLLGYALKYEPGTYVEYSNVGFALLGHVLARRANKSYEDLLIERICGPLGVDDTRITLTPSMRSRIAQGHNANLELGPLWDSPTLAGAGAVRSTANAGLGAGTNRQIFSTRKWVSKII